MPELKPAETAPTDEELVAAQARFDTDPSTIWDLTSIERRHFDAVPPMGEEIPHRGTLVRDKHGDAWRRLQSRWVCMSPIDGDRVTQVGRLNQSALIQMYGPIRVVGDRAGWRYRTIRGRRGPRAQHQPTNPEARRTP